MLKNAYFLEKTVKNCLSVGGFPPQRLLTFGIGSQKLRYLAKLWFFKLVMIKSNLKKCYDVITTTSPKIVIKVTS